MTLARDEENHHQTRTKGKPLRLVVGVRPHPPACLGRRLELDVFNSGLSSQQFRCRPLVCIRAISWRASRRYFWFKARTTVRYSVKSDPFRGWSRSVLGVGILAGTRRVRRRAYMMDKNIRTYVYIKIEGHARIIVEGMQTRLLRADRSPARQQEPSKARELTAA